MEKRKRGRPKVDTHLTEGCYDNRRKELNYKYMFEGTGVLMDAADEIPERTILYEMDKENRCFKACKTGIGRYIVAHGKVTIFFCFPDARVWGKHSAWTSTAKWRRPSRTVPALTLGQNRAEARTHLPFLCEKKR